MIPPKYRLIVILLLILLAISDFRLGDNIIASFTMAVAILLLIAYLNEYLKHNKKS